jgi:hypothetical protein
MDVITFDSPFSPASGLRCFTDVADEVDRNYKPEVVSCPEVEGSRDRLCEYTLAVFKVFFKHIFVSLCPRTHKKQCTPS